MKYCTARRNVGRTYGSRPFNETGICVSNLCLLESARLISKVVVTLHTDKRELFCRILGSHSCSYVCCHLREYSAEWSLCFLLGWFFTLKMEVICSCETPVHRRRYTPEDGKFLPIHSVSRLRYFVSFLAPPGKSQGSTLRNLLPLPSKPFATHRSFYHSVLCSLYMNIVMRLSTSQNGNVQSPLWEPQLSPRLPTFSVRYELNFF
jgi:hypothetical protein